MIAEASVFEPALVRRYDRPGPRYTSYPTADRFGEAFNETAYLLAAARRNTGGIERPLGLYFHLPFCRDVCFYCACNKIVTRDASKAARYLEYLGREIELQSALFQSDPRVSQMHWGGGTPTYYDCSQLGTLFQHIARHFELAPDGEYSIEIDPRTVEDGTLEALREMGFNRISLGVQDFDPRVQIAVHRLQGEARVARVVDVARRTGFRSINCDLIYGLPRQTPESFDATLEKILRIRPDRIALYNYAHMPALFKPQRRIAEGDLPSPDDKLRLLGSAIERFSAGGYAYIGMDHFALATDELAIAQRQGRLSRNFQGYATTADTDLVGLGVSAIGAIGATYSQNHRDLARYYECLDQSRIPIARGIELTADDLVRRSVIHGLMCSFTISKHAIEAGYLVDFDRIFAAELDDLADFERQGLLTLDDDWISVTPRGRFVIRNICMVFDRYLRERTPAGRYSRAI
jgi:oxygen-independent coproporphyrinogen-3 oxidase